MKSSSFTPSRAGFAALAGLASLVSLSLLPSPVQAQRRGGGPNPFLPPAAIQHAPRVRDYHVRHLKLIFDVNATGHSAHGVVTHYLTPLRSPLAAVILDARDNLKIEGCKIDGATVPFQQQKNQLTITPSSPLPNGKEAVVEITYTMPQTATSGGANGLGGFRWIDPNPNQPDRRPGFWTQGETTTNSAWVPCFDAPNDKCTSETHTTVPEEWTVIGNGMETPSTHDETAHTRTYHWTMKQPHSTYLLSLVGGELDVQKDVWRGVPLYYVVPKGKANLIPGSFGNTPDMLSWFSDNLGVKYPWPKYAQCAVFDFGGGMENVSATTLGQGSLTDARSGHFPMSSLNSHELGHQWFGDLVTCSDWGDIWLNEGFATFMEMFYAEHLDGKEAYDQEVEGKLRSYLFSARQFERPLATSLYSEPDAMFGQGTTYSKGGLILHMLRRELGDKVFFRALHRYLQTNRYQAVDTSDLEKAFSEETHDDAKPFFDQWVRKPGHPLLDMTWTYDDAHKEVVATVRQQQDTSNGTPIYNTPLTFGLIRGMTGGKTSTTQPIAFSSKAQTGDVLQRQRGVLSQSTQEFHLPIGEKPAVVLLDPDHDMIKEVKDTHWTDADMPSILRYAPDSVDRRLAAEKIAADGSMDEARIALFTTTLKTETAGNVAAYLLERLGTAKSEALRPLFRMQAQSKQTPRRIAALNALAQLPATEEDTRLLRAVALSDTEPYRVVIAGMNGLGGTNLAGNMDVFAHQIAQSSSRDQLAGASVQVLAKSKSDAAIPLLLTATRPPRSVPVRMQAIRVLDAFDPTSALIHDALLALLNDSQPRVQEEAIKTLSARKDKAALPALKALAQDAKSKSVQDAATEAVGQLELEGK